MQFQGIGPELAGILRSSILGTPLFNARFRPWSGSSFPGGSPRRVALWYGHSQAHARLFADSWLATISPLARELSQARVDARRRARLRIFRIHCQFDPSSRHSCFVCPSVRVANERRCENSTSSSHARTARLPKCWHLPVFAPFAIVVGILLLWVLPVLWKKAKITGWLRKT